MDRIKSLELPGTFLDTFVQCWAASRGNPTSTVHGRYPAGFRRNQTEDWEYFALNPNSEDFETLARTAIESPARMLTVITNDLETYKLLGNTAGFDVLEAGEVVMVVDMSSLKKSHAESRAVSSTPSSKEDEFGTEWEEQDVNGCRILTVKFTQNDQLAASGTVVVAPPASTEAAGSEDGLRFAVFDRIETVAQFRRRGLGSRVMGELCERAAEVGATTGLLLASADGQHLYKRLGWSSTYKVIIFGNNAGNPMMQKRRQEANLEAWSAA